MANITRTCGAGEVPSTVGGSNGYGTRYWDCCKPHCAWTANTSNLVQMCDANDNPIAIDDQISSGCEGGPAFTCHSQVPFAICEDLAYGFAAVPAGGDACGKCYQLEFDGTGKYGTKPAHQSLVGKKMIVKASNIGHDVSGGQFDIMIPGGGVGAFNGCSTQWGVSTSELGAQYGGFYTTCEQQLGYNASMEQYKSCVRTKCESVFQARGLDELYEGCLWFVDWMNAANNPNFKYKEVPCPSELNDLY